MRFLLWLALFLAPVVFHPLMVDPFEDAKAALVRILGVALLAAAAARAGSLRRASITPLDAAVAAWMAFEILATIASRSPLLSVFGEKGQHEGLLTSVGLAGLYVGARLISSDGRSPRDATHAWLAGTAVACAYAVLQALRLDPMPWLGAAELAGTIRPFGTLGHPNLLGAMTAPAAVVALVLVLEAPGRRWPYLAGAVLFTIVTMITFSRAAWLGLISGLLVVLALRSRRREARMGARPILIAAGVLAALAIVAIVTGSGELIATRLREIVTPAAGSGGSRLEIWRSAVAAWRDRPWLGQGPDAFQLVFGQYQTPQYWNLEWGLTPLHAHSIYLHALATRGALGLLALVACAITLGPRLRAGWRSGDVALGTALAGALAAFAVVGAFGAVGISGAAVIAAIAGMSGGAARAPARATRNSGRRAVAWGPIVAGAAAALAMLAWSAGEVDRSEALNRAERWGEQHGPPADAGSLQTFAWLATDCERVMNRVPGDDGAPRVLGVTLHLWAAGAPDPDPLLARAVDDLREAVRRQPLRSADHRLLADLRAAQALRGDEAARAECDAAFRRAAELSPWDGNTLVDWAMVRVALGRPLEARPIARRVTGLYPKNSLGFMALAESELAAGDSAAARAALARAAAGDWHGSARGEARARQLAQELGAAR
jgi:O-antigen ligase